MIVSINIRNIALIEEATIPFYHGMHILAGETGAGKSILIDSVNLILGGRADRDLIRNGYDKASVEAVFSITDSVAVQKLLQQESIDCEDHMLTLYREISRNGKNICRANGVMIPLSTLKEISRFLLDIHGQNEHTGLADPDIQRAFLDTIGDDAHQYLLNEVEDACELFLDNHRTYSRIYRENEKRNERIKEIEKSLQELHAAKLKPDEEELLKQEVELSHHMEKINRVLREAYSVLATGEDGFSVLSALNSASSEMKTLAVFGNDYTELHQRCSSAYFDMQELAFDIHTQLEKNDFDPAAMYKKEERLDLIRKLERKYGENIPAVLETQRQLEAEYETLKSAEDRLEELRKDHKQLLSRYRLLSSELTESRKKIAAGFEKQLTMELKELGMSNTVFKVEFIDHSGEKPHLPASYGDDDICFQISPNPGEPLKPMGKIASGGELSRLMLAIKSIEATHHGIGTMVFDEIDTGISGKMAQVVAEKMKKIAQACQVICVSHLSQTFTMADHRYLVEKKVHDDRTRTEVRSMDREDTIQFLAAMVSGNTDHVSDAREYAEKLLSQSICI